MGAELKGQPQEGEGIHVSLQASLLGPSSAQMPDILPGGGKENFSHREAGRKLNKEVF